MIPDVRTMWMVVATTALLFGFLEVWAGYGGRRDTSMIVWGAANLAGGVGAGLLSTYDVLPYVLSEALADGFLVLVWALIWAGGQAFAGRPVRWRTAFAAPVFVVVACLYIPPFTTDMVARIHVTSLAIVGYLVLLAVDSIRAERTERLVTRRALAVLAVLSLIPVAWRMVNAQMGRATFSLMENSAATAMPLVGLFIMAIAINVCLLLIGRERLSSQLAAAAARDGLTGALNRSGFLHQAQRTADADLTTRRPCSVVVMDLDEFKAVNDRHGHAAGDLLLAGFAATTRDHLRAEDVLGRMGGEEFCALLSGCSSPEALVIADRLRVAFAETVFTHADGTLTGTVSIGVAQLGADEDLNTAIERADAAMYRAKRQGRDRVMPASD